MYYVTDLNVLTRKYFILFFTTIFRPYFTNKSLNLFHPNRCLNFRLINLLSSKSIKIYLTKIYRDLSLRNNYKRSNFYKSFQIQNSRQSHAAILVKIQWRYFGVRIRHPSSLVVSAARPPRKESFVEVKKGRESRPGNRTRANSILEGATIEEANRGAGFSCVLQLRREADSLVP